MRSHHFPKRGFLHALRVNTSLVVGSHLSFNKKGNRFLRFCRREKFFNKIADKKILDNRRNTVYTFGVLSS